MAVTSCCRSSADMGAAPRLSNHHDGCTALCSRHAQRNEGPGCNGTRLSIAAAGHTDSLGFLPAWIALSCEMNASLLTLTVSDEATSGCIVDRLVNRPNPPIATGPRPARPHGTSPTSSGGTRDLRRCGQAVRIVGLVAEQTHQIGEAWMSTANETPIWRSCRTDPPGATYPA